jgi:hypothetical protein
VRAIEPLADNDSEPLLHRASQLASYLDHSKNTCVVNNRDEVPIPHSGDCQQQPG